MTTELVELYRKYRPTKFQEIVGQPEAVRELHRLVKEKRVPHCLLLTGESGVGKSTIARIMQKKLQCADADCVKINCATVEAPIETVRGIQQRMGLSPLSSPCRMWILEEVQSLSRAGFAQQALLDILEETPSHVYFILCTTNPEKLIKAIITRSTEIKLKPLNSDNLVTVLRSILEKEGKTVSDNVIERIVEVSDGSARKALVTLHQVLGLETEKEQLGAVLLSDSKRQAIELARALLNPKTQWKDIAEVLKGLDDDPEGLRHLVLAYASSVLLNGGKMAGRAYQILYAFEGNFYESKKAGLIRACYDIVGKDQ